MDLIDRQAAIDECYPITVDGEVYEVVQVETLMGLPSAQPEPKTGEQKTGKWLKAYGDHEAFGVRTFYRYCSACNESTVFPYNYCPHCGARMEGGDWDG